jgi:hypothetical protein
MKLLPGFTEFSKPECRFPSHVARSACVEHEAESIGDRRCLSFSRSLCLMASHIVSWGGNDHIVSPVLSSKPSIVSVNSILPYKRDSETFSVLQEAPRAAQSWDKRMSSLIEPGGSETSSTYPRTDVAGDGSFIRHDTYYFKDGNVTFLVRGVQP